MGLKPKLEFLLSLISDPSMVAALLRWPKFSITSYTMVSALKRQGLAPRTVIDVGANVGQFSVAAAKLWLQANIYAFEPIPQCVTQFERNVRSLANVKVFPVALGTEAGTTRIHVNKFSQSSSVLPLAAAHRKAFPKAEEQQTIEVPITSLDALASRLEIRRPSLLKLDVQGYERQVLNGATQLLGNIDYLVVETSFRPMYEGEMLFEDIFAYMRTTGFRFLRPVGWLRVPGTGEVLQMDALFARIADSDELKQTN